MQILNTVPTKYLLVVQHTLSSLRRSSHLATSHATLNLCQSRIGLAPSMPNLKTVSLLSWRRRFEHRCCPLFSMRLVSDNAYSVSLFCIQDRRSLPHIANNTSAYLTRNQNNLLHSSTHRGDTVNPPIAPPTAGRLAHGLISR